MRRIGAITPVWNQQAFIKPHFEMLKQLDKHVVMFQPGPLGQYQKEHGIGEKPDKSFSIIRKLFPEVTIKYSKGHDEFSHQLYNEILPHVQDCDIVFRLDVDMFFLQKDWDKLLNFIRSTEYDCYRVNFATHSPNYYVDYDHGVMDALERDPIAFNPKLPLIWDGTLSYPSYNQTTIGYDAPGSWKDWRMHHLRGWNKPKSTGDGWIEAHEEWVKQYGEWFSLPRELKEKIELWQKQLNAF